MGNRFDSEFYKRILNRIHSNIYITDTETDQIVFMNDMMKKTYNIVNPEGEVCWKVLQKNQEERCDFCKITEMEKDAGSKERIWKEYSEVTGRTYMNFDVLETWNGKNYHVQNSLDITDQLQLSLDASTDELTRLLNRQAGRKRLEKTLKDLKDGEQFIIVLYDMNGLKWVNDTYGHLEGDRLLRYVASELKAQLKEPDFIFRLSGDEFIVVFMNKEIYQADQWMKNMLETLEEKKAQVGIDYSVSFSYGLAKVRGEEHLTVSDVLSIADTQMYIKKRDYHIAQGKKRLMLNGGSENKDKKEFKYSQEYLFDAFSESVDGYTFIGNLKTGEFLYSYKMMLEFGLPKQVLRDAAAFWGERIHPEDRELFLRSNQEIADGKADRHTISYRAKNAEGKWVHLICKGKMIRDEEGNPDLFAGIIRNLDNQETWRSLSDARKSLFYFMADTPEKNSAKIEERLLNFVNRNIPGGIMAVCDDNEFSLICFNQALLEYTDSTYEELLQKTGGKFKKLIYEEDREMVVEEVAKQLREKGAYEVYYRVVGSDGRFLWVYDIGKYDVNDRGEKYILSFFVDATDVMEQEKELRFINDNSVSGVFKASMTKGFPVLYANDGYFKIHGYTKKQMEEEIGNEASHLVYEEDLDRVQQEIRLAIDEGKGQIVLEYRIRRREGDIRWIHVNAGLMSMADGSSIMIGMVMDITERRVLEEQLYHTEEIYKLVRNHTQLSVWEFDIENRSILLNDVREDAEYPTTVISDVPESIIEMDSIYPDSVETFREVHQKIIDGQEKVVATIQIRKKNGGYKWEKITYIALNNDDDKAAWAIGVSEDVTVQKEAEIRAFNQERMSEIIAKDVLYSFRMNLSKNYLEEAWNQNGEQLGSTSEKFTYHQIFKEILKTIANGDDRKSFEKYFSEEQIYKYADSGNFAKEFEFRQEYKDGKIMWVNLSMKIILSPSSGEKILFASARNIDRLKRRELSLQKKAETDRISGLYDWETTKLLIENVVHAKDNPIGERCFMLMNIDGFKNVNRIGGFAAGDEILRQVSSIIRKKIPSACVTGRLSSDTFVIYLYDLKNRKAVHKEAQAIVDGIKGKYVYKDWEFEITVSVGAVDLVSRNITYEQMYENACYALETAKRSGGNRLVFYDEIEGGDLGQEICMKVDPETYEVLSMSGNGRAAFGFRGICEINQKCYELLHNRTSPCPFCSGSLKIEEKHEWECFIPRLNRLMYIDEHLEGESTERVRAIRMNPKAPKAAEETYNHELSAIFRQSWSQIENGEGSQNVYRTFLEYIGKYYRAEEVTLYKREGEKGALRKIIEWSACKKGVAHKLPVENMGRLTEMLMKAYPTQYIFIDEKDSDYYEEVCRIYGVDRLEYPVFLAASYRNEELKYCMLIEKGEPDIRSTKVVEMVMEMIRRMGYLYDMSKNYEYALHHDPKTGVLNYESYIQRLEQMNGDSLITLGMSGLRMVDLRKYNQTYGKGKGDQSLIFAANLMIQLFGEKNCYRVSRTKFLAVCEDISYEQFSERCKKLEAEMQAAYPDLAVVASAWEQSSISAEKLQNQIREKLFVAQNRKKNDGTYINESTVSEVLADMQESIKKGNFRTFFQPKADVSTGEICGAEALVRFQDAEGKIIPPARFLPAIERAGLIRHIDLFVLEDVCRTIKKWISEGWKPFTISLNYSRATILEPGILDETNRIVERWGISKELIEIEITESIGSIDSSSLKNIVDQFAEAGYKIALDDYGAEYSNVYVLYSLQLGTLKLDRRVINDIYHDEKARIVVENVIDVCRKFNIVSVAEGVETEEHLKVLKEMDCDVIQGYYINKPLSEEDFRHQYIS